MGWKLQGWCFKGTKAIKWPLLICTISICEDCPTNVCTFLPVSHKNVRKIMMHLLKMLYSVVSLLYLMNLHAAQVFFAILYSLVHLLGEGRVYMWKSEDNLEYPSKEPSTLCFEIGSLPGPELDKQDRMVNQWALGICLYLRRSSEITKAYHHQASRMCSIASWNQHQVPILARQVHGHHAISPAHTFVCWVWHLSPVTTVFIKRGGNTPLTTQSHTESQKITR